MAASLYERTKGPLAEGQILAFCGAAEFPKAANEALPVAKAKFSNFQTARLRHIFKWLSGGRLRLISCAMLGLLLVSASPHPLYIAVTEINHNPKDKILEISCKIFTNDFETVLAKVSGGKVDLSSAKDKTISDKLIADYVGRHLRLKVDGKPVQLHFVGSENEEDGTWSYFQVNDIPAVKRIDVGNDLLYDGFNQQINIMHVTVGGQRQSTRLDYPQANATFQF